MKRLTSLVVLLIFILLVFCPAYCKELSIKFIAQGKAGGWPGNMNCGQACLVMAKSYFFGEDPSVEDILNINQYLGKNEKGGKGSSSSELVRSAENLFDLRARRSKSNWESIKEEIDQGRPVIVAVTAKFLKSRKYQYPGAHFVLATGYTDTHVIVNDPGTHQGVNFQYSLQEFRQASKAQDNEVVFFDIAVTKIVKEPLTVKWTQPENGATDVSTFQPQIIIVFNKSLVEFVKDTDKIITITPQPLVPSEQTIPALRPKIAIDYDLAEIRIENYNFLPGTHYKIIINKNLRAKDGSILKEPFVLEFTTAAKKNSYPRYDFLSRLLDFGVPKCKIIPCRGYQKVDGQPGEVIPLGKTNIFYPGEKVTIIFQLENLEYSYPCDIWIKTYHPDGNITSRNITITSGEPFLKELLPKNIKQRGTWKIEIYLKGKGDRDYQLKDSVQFKVL